MVSQSSCKPAQASVRPQIKHLKDRRLCATRNYESAANNMTKYFNFPFLIDKNGYTSTINREDHAEQLIEQVLFTIQGERVNRPTFGTGINQLVFAPNSEELATATQLLIQGSLEQWLSDIISVSSVAVTSDDSRLTIVIEYYTIMDRTNHVANFVREI
jgi:uncharacterized protein